MNEKTSKIKQKKISVISETKSRRQEEEVFLFSSTNWFVRFSHLLSPNPITCSSIIVNSMSIGRVQRTNRFTKSIYVQISTSQVFILLHLFILIQCFDNYFMKIRAIKKKTKNKWCRLYIYTHFSNFISSSNTHTHAHVAIIYTRIISIERNEICRHQTHVPVIDR